MKVELEIDQRLYDALTMLAQEDRRTVEEYSLAVIDRYIFGQGGRDRVPLTDEEVAEIMGHRRSRPKREALTARQRNSIFEACDGKCSYCHGTVLYTEPWDVDHIVPVAKGGTNDRANLTLSCATCNRRKHIKAVA